MVFPDFPETVFRIFRKPFTGFFGIGLAIFLETGLNFPKKHFNFVIGSPNFVIGSLKFVIGSLKFVIGSLKFVIGSLNFVISTQIVNRIENIVCIFYLILTHLHHRKDGVLQLTHDFHN